MLAGQMGRDSAIAERLVEEGCQVSAVSEFYNPSLRDAARESGGEIYIVKDSTDPNEVSSALNHARPNLFLTNQDEALQAGVIDTLKSNAQNRDVLFASPEAEAARIEWDKFFGRSIIDEIDYQFSTTYNPEHWLITTPIAAREAIRQFSEKNKEVVIKPRGLTGGKGVKVMGPHLHDFAEAENYALEVLGRDGQVGVSIEEKLIGHEFTIQGLTDGLTLIAPPATYDYPYREDGDIGPGTGGMGCFTMAPGEQLPFLKLDDYEEALWVMRQALIKMKEQGREFKGVLYGSFFKTDAGLKVVEFNARMGDPEGISIVELLHEKTSLKETLRAVADGSLEERAVQFKKAASTVVYLVSPDYGYKHGTSYSFDIDPEVIAEHGCRAYFAAAYQQSNGSYRTAGASRTLAISTLAPTPWEARECIHRAINEGVSGKLAFRHDIGDADYLQKLG